MGAQVSGKLRVFLILWRLIWFVGMPLALLYLWHRGRRDPEYRSHLHERFGVHPKQDRRHIWIHAVSLGELRSAEPLIRDYLAQGYAVVTTHFTPAGRRGAARAFADDIAAGQLSAVWVPFDYGLAYRRFFKAFQPQLGLVMEVEIWPGMIMAAARAGVPLVLCNGQYPTRSHDKDRGKWVSRRDLVPHFAGALVKNDLQADRFTQLGQRHVAITGEMRFEIPPDPAQVEAAQAFIAQHPARCTTTFASVVAGEDDLFIAAIQGSGTRAIYVPRAPERFDETYERLRAAGLKVIRRSTALGPDLRPSAPLDPEWDILLGDSLGEMTFYLSLGACAVIGGGYVPKGSHNIIEPLTLGKPVIVGPHIWTIEFPATQALRAGVARQIAPQDLTKALGAAPDPSAVHDIADFLDQYGGSTAKTQAALAQFGITLTP